MCDIEKWVRGTFVSPTDIIITKVQKKMRDGKRVCGGWDGRWVGIWDGVTRIDRLCFALLCFVLLLQLLGFTFSPCPCSVFHFPLFFSISLSFRFLVCIFTLLSSLFFPFPQLFLFSPIPFLTHPRNPTHIPAPKPNATET